MNVKRFILEFGTGIDFHGQDDTGAAKKAVRNAISRSCLCGLVEICGLSDLNSIVVEVTLAAPRPGKVRGDEVLVEIPFGEKSIKVVEGGMQVPGLFLPELGDDDDSIVVANACVEVKVPC